MHFKKNIIFKSLYAFQLYLSFIALSVLVSGLNFQYERINMMMLILQIFLSSLFIKSSQRNNYLLVVISALLFLTIYRHVRIAKINENYISASIF